ncbi:MAG: hypothetical protein ACK4Z9_05485 [Thermodesulfovibrionales bacterium]
MKALKGLSFEIGSAHIALVDMMPELHKKAKGGKIALQLVTILFGIFLMW